MNGSRRASERIALSTAIDSRKLAPASLPSRPVPFSTFRQTRHRSLPRRDRHASVSSVSVSARLHARDVCNAERRGVRSSRARLESLQVENRETRVLALALTRVYARVYTHACVHLSFALAHCLPRICALLVTARSTKPLDPVGRDPEGNEHKKNAQTRM